MYPYLRIAAIAYALAILIGGYLVVDAIQKSLSHAERMESLGALSVMTDHKVLTYDSISPASGG